MSRGIEYGKCTDCQFELIDKNDFGETYGGFKYNKIKCVSCKSYVYCKWCYENNFFKAISFLERMYCHKCTKTYCEYDNLPLYTGSCMVYQNRSYTNLSKEKCNIDLFYRFTTFINNLPNGIIKIYNTDTGYREDSIHKTFRIKYKYHTQVNSSNIQYLTNYESTNSHSEINHIPITGPFIYYQSNQQFLKGNCIDGLFVDKFYYYDSYRYFTIEALKVHHKGKFMKIKVHEEEEKETYFEANSDEDHFNGYDNTDFRLSKYETTFKIITYPKDILRNKLEYCIRFLYTCNNIFFHRDNSIYKYIDKLIPYYDEINSHNIISHRIYNDNYYISAPIGPFILYSNEYIPYFKVDYKIIVEDGYEMSVFDNVLYSYNKNSENYELTKRIVFKDGKRNGLYYEYDGKHIIFCNYIDDKIEGKYYKCQINSNKAEKHIFNYDNILQFQKKKKIYTYNKYENSLYDKEYAPKKNDYSVCSIEEDAEKTIDLNTPYRKLLIKKYIYEKKNELYEKIFEVMTVDNFKDYFLKNDSSIVIECNYVNGKIVGYYEEFYFYNTMKYLSKTCFYNENGLLDGDYKKYLCHSNEIEEHKYYKDDKIIDFHHKYYYVIDEKYSTSYDKKYIQCVNSTELYDKDGNLDGLSTYYYKAEYKDFALGKDCNESGNIINNNCDEDDDKYYLNIYFGRVKYTILYDKGNVLEKKDYYENGVVKGDCIRKNITDYPHIKNHIKYDRNKNPYTKEEKKLEFEKLWTKEEQYIYLQNTYYNNGTKMSEFYTYNQYDCNKIGKCIEYYENDKIKEKSTHICIKSYYEYGIERKKIECTYFYNNPKNSMEKEEIYDENGELISIQKYNKNGKQINN